MSGNNFSGSIPYEGLNQSIAATTSIFGEALISTSNSVVQLIATYGLLNTSETFVSGSGSATVTADDFVCSTGTAAGSYGVIRSRDVLHYRPGVGACGRFTARFSPPVSNSTQRAGLFTISNALMFGYNGTDFGILYGRGGEPNFFTITVSAAATGNEAVDFSINGSTYTVNFTSGTAAFNAYELAASLTSQVASYDFWQNGSTVIAQARTAASAAAAGYTVGGGTFRASFVTTSAGVAVTTNWVSQANWNVDTVPWLNPRKGNVYQIEYQYLGYGNMLFSVENPSSGKFQPVHELRYVNTATTPSLTQPSMRLGWVAASLGSTTNLSVAGASAAGFVQGHDESIARGRSYTNQKTSVGSTPTNILTLRNRGVFANKPNLTTLRLHHISGVTDSTKGVILKGYIDPVLAGTPNFSYLDSTNSSAEVDTAATTYSSGGRLVFSFGIGSGAAQMDLDNLYLTLIPGERLVITAQVTSGAASTVDVSINWQEDR